MYSPGLLDAAAASLSRLLRCVRQVQDYTPAQFQKTLERRPERHTFFTIAFLSIVLVNITSYMIFCAEQASPNPNITSAQGAMWWAIVTITTVGYGDHYPTTASGRIASIILMFIGVSLPYK